MDISKSERIKKDYIVQHQIGKGGMAKVYLAIHRKSNKKVAIKTLDFDPSKPQTKWRFKEELKIVQGIEHDNIVKFYQGIYDKTDQFMVMEYVNGQMLKDYITAKSRLDVKTAVDFATQISSGFASLEGSGIVHRDLKSSNIMVNGENKIKIIDFGIAQDSNTPRLTEDRKVIGSVQYLAPELLNGVKATIKSDVYSMGILLYEMLVGKTPFNGGKPIDVAVKHQNSEITPVNAIRSDVPQALANIIIKATAKDPSHRYDNFSALKNDLETCLDRVRVAEKKINLAKMKTPTTKSNRMILFLKSWIFIVIIAVLVMVAIILLMVLKS